MQNKSKDKVASFDILGKTGNQDRSVLDMLTKFWRTKFALDVLTAHALTTCTNTEIILCASTDPGDPQLSLWSGQRMTSAWSWCKRVFSRILLPLHRPPTVCRDWLVPMSEFLTTALGAPTAMMLADSQQIIKVSAPARGHLPFHMVRKTGWAITVFYPLKEQEIISPQFQIAPYSSFAHVLLCFLMGYWESVLWVCSSFFLRKAESRVLQCLRESRYLRDFKIISSIYFSSRQAGRGRTTLAGGRDGGVGQQVFPKVRAQRKKYSSLPCSKTH